MSVITTTKNQKNTEVANMPMNLIKKAGKVTWIDPIDGSKSSKTFNLYSDVEADIKTGFDAIVSLTANETADYSYQENYEIV
jgi:hypothetical protein